jgi:hypothetical protein
MPGRHSSIHLAVTPEQRSTLEAWLRRHATPQSLVRRACAILALADGETFTQAAQQAGLRERHVRKWVARFLQRGLDGLSDAPRSGRPPTFSPSAGRALGQARL